MRLESLFSTASNIAGKDLHSAPKARLESRSIVAGPTARGRNTACEPASRGPQQRNRVQTKSCALRVIPAALRTNIYYDRHDGANRGLRTSFNALSLRRTSAAMLERTPDRRNYDAQ